jgi:hypothetical protein
MTNDRRKRCLSVGDTDRIPPVTGDFIRGDNRCGLCGRQLPEPIGMINERDSTGTDLAEDGRPRYLRRRITLHSPAN